MMLEVDRRYHLRERRLLAAIVGLLALLGVVCNLAEISWLSTVLLTALAVGCADAMMGYSADLRAMKISDQDKRRRMN